MNRHPRDSYYLATKMSNHRLAGNGLSPAELYDESVKMYRKSFENLGTDYFDYYLLHIVGGGSGMPLLMERFFDNGLLDFLLKEREAGRIRNLGFSYHGDVRVFDYLLSRHDEFKWDFVQIQLNYVDYRHASGMNFNADYLYGELAERGIPAIVMEPLLGGRLTSLTLTYLNGPSQAAQARRQHCVMGVPVCRIVSRSADGAERHDLYGASSGQSCDIFAT